MSQFEVFNGGLHRFGTKEVAIIQSSPLYHLLYRQNVYACTVDREAMHIQNPAAGSRPGRSVRRVSLDSCFWALANTRETVNSVTSFETIPHPYYSSYAPQPPSPTWIHIPCALHVLTPQCMSEVMNFNSFTPPRCQEGKADRQKWRRRVFRSTNCRWIGLERKIPLLLDARHFFNRCVA